MKEQLSPALLAALFENSLVNITDDKAPLNHQKIKQQQPSKNIYLGNYANKIIVLVSDNEHAYLSDENLEFLTGILNACKLSLVHIALINFNNHSLSFKELQTNMQPQYLLLFGIKALQIELPFTMPDYQVQQYSDCFILTAPSLNNLNNTTPEAKTEKTKLWKSLKKMLDLK